MNPTRLVLALLVPAVVGVHATASYLGRSMWWSLGRDFELVLSSNQLGALGFLAGAAGAAVIGALAGPGAAMVLGLLVGAAGHALVGSGALATGGVLYGVGRALVAIGSSAALARAVPPANAAGRMALYTATYGLVNLGATVAPMGASLGDIAGYTPILFACVGVLAVTALVAAPAAVLPWMRPDDLDTPAPDRVALGVAATTALVGGGAWAVWTFGNDAQWQVLYNQGGNGAPTWLFSINPSAAMLSSLAATVALGAAGLSGFRVPPLLVAAVGFAGAGLALLPSAVIPGAVVAAGVSALTGLAEPLLYAGLWAQVTGRVPWRAAPVFGAVLYGLTLVPNALTLGLGAVGVDTVDISGVVASLTGVVVLGAGVLAAAAGLWVHKLEADELPADGFSAAGPDPYGFDGAPRG